MRTAGSSAVGTAAHQNGATNIKSYPPPPHRNPHRSKSGRSREVANGYRPPGYFCQLKSRQSAIAFRRAITSSSAVAWRVSNHTPPPPDLTRDICARHEAVLIAQDNEAFAHNGRHEVITCLGELTLMPDTKPLRGENSLFFLREHFL